MEELLHHSIEPVTLDRSRIYDQRQEKHFLKPNGLWLSVSGSDDWESWCRANEFGCGDIVYRVTLRADANIAWLCSGADIDMFHTTWSEPGEVWRGGTAPLSDEYVRLHWEVNWQRVAQQFDGIIITPYQWSRRMGGPFWYYGWDCASGCVWKLDAVETFERININA